MNSRCSHCVKLHKDLMHWCRHTSDRLLTREDLTKIRNCKFFFEKSREEVLADALAGKWE